MGKPAADRQQNGKKEKHTDLDILYTVDDAPPWYLAIMLALQQFLTCFGATFSFPFIIGGAICIAGDSVGMSQLISTVVFVSGLSSLLQSTFGVRLPIIQSVSYAFVTPIFVIMDKPCPKFDNTTMIEAGSDEHKAIWQSRLCELQGCLMVACTVQIIIGFSGGIGFLLRYIGPLTIAPTISLIGLSLFGAATDKAKGHWWICIMTVTLVTIFSQYLRNVEIPCPCMKRPLKIFALFPVLFGIIISWIICLILTESGALTDDPKKWGYEARTDVNSRALDEAPWFRFPYPGQWGTPTVSLSGVMGMMAAIVASMIESVGDYYACARLSGAPPPPGSAINRGIGLEGITCFLSAAWGCGGGNTSYSENIGAIGITKVGSRVVIQIAGVIMILLGCFGKFGALFTNLPQPVVAGLFFVMFGMVTAVGISNLQFVDLNSSRNLFVFGFSTFFGLSMPAWLASNSEAIDTGNDTADQVLRVLCSTSMLVGGVVAFVLDNTIPGTKEERGLISSVSEVHASKTDLSIYNLPLIQPYLNRCRITRYIPFCPNFVWDKKQDSETVSFPIDDSDFNTDGEIGIGKKNEGYANNESLSTSL